MILGNLNHYIGLRNIFIGILYSCTAFSISTNLIIPFRQVQSTYLNISFNKSQAP